MNENVVLKIFHAADLHLGLKFQSHPEAQDSLIQARVETLGNLVDQANVMQSNILAIAGDLFDRTSIKVSDIQQAVIALNRFEGEVVLVLPGNHDYVTPDSTLWERFKQEAGENVLVLDKKESKDLSSYGLNAVVYPAPCHSKHSSENAVKWIKDTEKASDNIHIGIAHGSIEGVSDFDQRYFPMTKSELEKSGVDIWLMGHTHITWPDKPGSRDIIFNPGTPEPDGFDCKHEGRAFFHAIDEQKNIQTEILSTGTYRFVYSDSDIKSVSDIDQLIDSYKDEQWRRTVLKLKVEGKLEPELYEYWKENRQSIRDKVLELKLNDSGVRRKVTPEQIQKEFTEGSFPEQFLSSFTSEEEEELQMAYELIKEVQK